MGWEAIRDTYASIPYYQPPEPRPSTPPLPEEPDSDIKEPDEVSR